MQSFHHPYHLTRIAPTPSGFLHLGNVLSFALTAELAQRSNARILLRIDDLDRDRVNREYLQDIFDTLSFLGFEWDEGPHDVDDFEQHYSQLKRLDLYNTFLDKLCQAKLVYACTCSRKQLNEGIACNCFDKNWQLSTPNAAWRLVTIHAPVCIRNYNGEVAEAHLPDDMQNFIVRKKDGFPGYQLTSVADDLFYGTDLIVRGNDLWPSTIAQHVLAKALGLDDFAKITFYHHPLLTGEAGEKLSKSAGSTSVKYLREHGKSPADIFNLIAQMIRPGLHADSWQELAAIY
ncbi:MAG: glutamate--tRNA ligase family protein [Mucilaginibacter sp.]